jgi:hypothetical protein
LTFGQQLNVWFGLRALQWALALAQLLEALQWALALAQVLEALQ